MGVLDNLSPAARLTFCQDVATERRSGIPDPMIAALLGVNVAELRAVCPDDPSDPLGLHRDRERSGVAPHRPRGHVGDPFAGVAPYVAPSQPQQEDDPVTYYEPRGDAGAIVLLLWLLSGG